MTGASDIRISTALPQHPKYKRLRARLGWPGIAHLFHFWLWVRTNRPGGDLTGMSGEDIELAIDWPGEPGAFTAAMVDVRFLDGADGCYRVHDWDEHQPWAAGFEDRSERGSWASLCRRYGREYAAEQMPAYAARLAAKEASEGPSNSRRNSASSSRVVDERSAKSNQGVEVGVLSDANGGPIAGLSDENVCPVPDTVSVTDTVSVSVSVSKAKATTPDGVVVDGADAPADSPTRSDPIPYAEIVAEYNRTMAALRKARELTPKRRTLIRSAWQASASRRSMHFWRAYFAECQSDPFLNGTGPYREPHANWRPDFDYLLSARCVTKVFEQAMDRMDRAEGESE